MNREELLVYLAERILAHKHPDRPLKVAVDGRCAAGKSVLADDLAPLLRQQRLDVLRPSVDGFHRPREYRYRQGAYSAIGYYEDAFDYQAVAENLLQPLSQDSFPVRRRQVAHDVRTDMPVDAPPIRVSANTVLLFDGVFLFRREIDAYWDLRILLDIDTETSVERALQRDKLDPPEITRRKYRERYDPAWEIYVAQENPAAKADVIVDHRDFRTPRILKTSVTAG